MGSHFPVTDPVVVIAIVAAIIVTAPILLERYRIPGMIGVLVAGAVLGPNALGVLARDQSIVLLGTVGLLFIMFTAALEIDLAILKRSRLQSFVFGVFTFAIPQGVGTMVAHYLLGFDWPAALLLASLFASHTLLAYPIASRLGLAKNRAVTTALGGTILTDTAALLVLAVVAGSTRGELTSEFWMRLGMSMAIYVAGVLIVLPRLARWFFRNVRPDGTAEFVFVLAAVFTTASLSHTAGVEPIVGAFLAGLALNRTIPHNGTLMNRINFTGDALFVPFFLLSVGMLLDVRVFAAGLRSWYISIGMLGCVLVCKYLAAALARLVFGYSKDEGRIVFGLSVAQAAATLAAVMVGYELELFDDAVVNGAIVMMLVTCTVAPWIVDRHGRKLALAQEESARDDDRAPQRIMVSLSKPDTAQPLVELALMIRDAGQQQPVYPLTVVRESDDSLRSVAYAEKMLSRAVIHLTAADVPSQPVTRIDMNVASALLRARKELRITDVIMGWSPKPSAQTRFFGSFLEHLLEERDYALWVSRLLDPLSATSRVLFLIPPNAEREHGFAHAAAAVKTLSNRVGAELTLWVDRADEAAVNRRMHAIKPAIELKTRALDSWSSLVQSLSGQVSDLDLIVLYGPREGGLAWTPSTSRLPLRLAGHFASTNLVVIYPAEPQEEPFVEITERPERRAPAFLRQEGFVLGLASIPAADAVVTILEEGLPGQELERSDRLVSALLASTQELGPGVVLLHTSSRWIQEPTVLVGVSRPGLRVASGMAPAHLLFVLLRPLESDPQTHLNMIAEIARLVHEPAVVEEARQADTVAQLLAAMNARLKAGKNEHMSTPAAP